MRHDLDLRVVTPASGLPVTVAEAKAHAIVETTEHDAQIEAFIKAALAWLQPPVGWLGRSVLSQTLRADLPAWPRSGLLLPCGPITSLTSVKYFDTANVERTLDPALYFLDEDALVWTDAFSPPALYARPRAVRITYVGGYANAAAIPEPIRLAIMTLVAHWFENRDAVAVAGAPQLIPLGVHDLLSPYKLWV